MKKGKKQLVHRIVFGVLAALFLVFNVAIYVAFDYLTKVTNNMGLKLDSVEAESVRAEATEFTKEITREGMVLLRNKDNALPLPAGSAINLFGWSSTQMIIGGNGGSGGVSSASVNIKSSLEAAGFSVNEDLYSMYQSYQEARDIVPEEEYGGYSPSWATPEPAISDSTYYTQELLDGTRSFSDIAAMTISRSSGEGLDIPAGYLSLTQDEKDIIKYLRDNFKTVIVLVNSNAAMELGYLEEIDVDAAIFMPGTGGALIPAIITVLAFATVMYALRGIYYATMGEAGIPLALTGTATGIISVIGYLPDSYMNVMLGSFMDKNPGAAGFKYVFGSIVVFAVIGIVLALIIWKISKNVDQADA